MTIASQNLITSSKIRIIGGKWKNRKLLVPNIHNLRPSMDRVRTTLFNWLSSRNALYGYCLDAYAGTGVLGFEALSRGVSKVIMVDNNVAITTLLQQQAGKLQLSTNEINIFTLTFPMQALPVMLPFNLIFLDPPYRQNLLLPCCFYLAENDMVAKDAHIYLAAEHAINNHDLPVDWNIIKVKRYGQTYLHLVKRA